MKPSEKSKEVEQSITNLTGIDRKECIENNYCTMCGGLAERFKDEASRKEFSISGMCQQCQDQVFE